MKCDTIRKHLSAWQDGELTPGMRRNVSTHLDQCSDCRLELTAIEQLTANLHKIPPPPISPGFPARVMARIVPQPQRRTGWLPAFAYAALFLLIFGLGLVITPRKAAPFQPESIIKISLTEALLDAQNAQLASVQDGIIDLFKEDVP